MASGRWGVSRWAFAAAGAVAAGVVAAGVYSLASGGTDRRDARELTKRLLQACRDGNVEEVSRLLAEGLEADAENGDSGTGLMFASERGHDSVCRRLLESGADPCRRHTVTGMSSIHFAAAHGRAGALELLLSAAGAVDCRASDGATPLHLAAVAGHAVCARRLLAKGAASAARRRDGATPLHLAAHSDNDDVIREVCECGADVDAAMPLTGVTPLMAAARYDCLRAVAQLLANGAQPNARTRPGRAAGAGAGRTALMIAAQHGAASVVPALLRGGAEADGFASDGLRSALVFAARRGHLSVVRQLARGGATVDARNARGSTALMMSCVDGLRESARELVVLGADPSAAESLTGFTPLMYAAALGHSELCSDLLAYGADPEARQVAGGAKPRGQEGGDGAGGGDRGPGQAAEAAGAGPALLPADLTDGPGRGSGGGAVSSLLGGAAAGGTGRTALMWAAARGHETAVRVLVEAGGADVNATDSGGRSALDLVLARARREAESGGPGGRAAGKASSTPSPAPSPSGGGAREAAARGFAGGASAGRDSGLSLRTQDPEAESGGRHASSSSLSLPPSSPLRSAGAPAEGGRGPPRAVGLAVGPSDSPWAAIEQLLRDRGAILGGDLDSLAT